MKQILEALVLAAAVGVPLILLALWVLWKWRIRPAVQAAAAAIPQRLVPGDTYQLHGVPALLVVQPGGTSWRTAGPVDCSRCGEHLLAQSGPVGTMPGCPDCGGPLVDCRHPRRKLRAVPDPDRIRAGKAAAQLRARTSRDAMLANASRRAARRGRR